MSRVIHSLVAFALVASCGCKDEPKPTSEFKVPDVPESGSSQGKGDLSKLKSKK